MTMPPPLPKDDGDKNLVLSQILTRSVTNQEDLLCLLREELPQQLKQWQQSGGYHPVSVIVLDSIADMFRVGNGEGAFEDKANLSQRSSLLFEIAAILRKLSDEFRIPIVVINQVSSDFSSSDSHIPTLGLSWANCVNTSYLLRRSSIMAAPLAESTGSNTPAATRQIFLTKSSHHRVEQQAVFQITSQGILWVQAHKKQRLSFLET
jgi:DNA-repair protein XRCC3